jgi:ATP-binding cassette subfamily B protein
VLFAITSLGMVTLLLLGNELLQELIAHGSASSMSPRLVLLVVAALAVAGVVSFAGSAAQGLHRLLVERSIRYYTDVVLQVAASVRLREFDSPEFHDRLQRARTNNMAPMTLAMSVPTVLGAFIGVVGVAIGLLVINPWLVPITLLACIPLWLVGRANSENMYSFSFGNTPNDRARFNIERIVNERQSAPEVRAFSLAPFLLGRWSRLYDERIDGIRALVRRFIRWSALGSALGAVVLAAVFAIVYELVRHGGMSIASAATAAAAVLLLANRSQQVATNLGQMTEQGLYVDELLEFRRWAQRVRPSAPVAVEPFHRLEVDQVSFRYPATPTQTRPALDHVSFDIAAGEVVAIVGRNGSGKTTLAKLLCGLYEPTAGTVRWDGRPLTDLTGDGGLSRAGVVFQDFGRYWFSAADNIGIGDTARIDDRAGIHRAATAAGAGFLADLTHGYDTPLATELNGGIDLSGGQWQRVAIARVLFRDASFIVLDEPTASLDAEAEAALFDTIQGLRAGRTVVIISHRFSTVRSADRILVMHDGRLVEQGSHAELMELPDGRYARMYGLQARNYADPVA